MKYFQTLFAPAKRGEVSANIGKSGNLKEAPLPVRTKILYGFGSVAYGIKDNGFAVFLLFYYNQVVGLRADLVSLAIAIALFADALLDPLIGQMTDKTRTSIGRRHPWLYISTLPIAVSWFFLWNPPAGNETMQFLYLLLLAMLVRISLSLNEVPSLALLPELTRDYHDRTSIARYRSLFGWGSGLLMMFLAYSMLLVPNAKYPNGLLNVDGYTVFSIIGAIAMALAVVVSAWGTHTRIVTSYNTAGTLPQTNESLRQIFGTFGFRPFKLLMFAGIFAFANQGLVFALTPYLLTHVWQFSQAQLAIYSLTIFIGALSAFIIVSPISRRFGKASGAGALTLISAFFGTLPYWLRLAGLFPEIGSPILFPLVIFFIILSTGAGISVMILTTSMMADVTDVYEFEYGKRSEGVFSSGMWLMQKSVGALGILFAGLIISVIALPDGASPGSLDISIVNNLSWIFASLTVTIAAIGAWSYSLFPLSEKDHETRMAQLSAKKQMLP